MKSCIVSFTFQQPIDPSMHPSIYLCTHSFISCHYISFHSFILAFIHSFICHQFIHSFVPVPFITFHVNNLFTLFHTLFSFISSAFQKGSFVADLVIITHSLIRAFMHALIQLPSCAPSCCLCFLALLRAFASFHVISSVHSSWSVVHSLTPSYLTHCHSLIHFIRTSCLTRSIYVTGHLSSCIHWPADSISISLFI